MLKNLLLKTIKFYQFLISPVLGKHCRFFPSCSEYSYLSIKQYGALKGAWKSVKRILRCHPWNKGGVDLP